MTRWPAVRINHHRPDAGELLRDAVTPMVAELRARGTTRLLVRPHWSEGPHVLVASDIDEARFDESVYEPSRERLESWLRANPSGVNLDPAQYRRQVLQLAETEGEPPGPDRLAPDDSIERGWYERAAPYSVPELGAARDEFQMRTLDLALALVARRLEARPRLMVDLATMVAAAGLSGGEDFDFWPISMLAHCEVYLTHRPGLGASFEELTAKLRPALEENWRRCGITAEDRLSFESASPELRDWSAALADLNRRVAEVIRQRPDLRRSAALYEGEARPRPFLDWDSASLKALMSTDAHLRFRIVINYVYGLFPLIGLKPVERPFLCYLLWYTIATGAPGLVARADRAVRTAAERQAG